MVALYLLLPQNIFAGKGFMGGAGDVTVNNLIPTVEANTAEEGVPDTVTGPLSDNKSTSGQLFGDLYKLLRYQGHESTKMIPEVDAYGKPICRSGGVITPCGVGKQNLVPGSKPIGGEPILSAGYGIYAKEITSSTGAVSYVQANAPYPSQCVQPTANYAKWGDIREKSGTITGNTLPLIMLYDPTWGRTECAVGKLESSTVDSITGELTTVINEYFIQPGETFNDKKYCEGVKWIDMVEEVDFGRLNLSRSPEAVLQAAFDEAINAINNANSISLDSAGRLLLTSTVYSETEMTTTSDGCAIPVATTVVKAIDSPLENLALYVKLMKDGHLITPGDERSPIDRSEYGGIPLWKMLELTDGPSTALRPTVDITKLNATFPDLVDAATFYYYYTDYQCYNDTGVAVDCLCYIPQSDGSEKTGMCTDVVTRKLIVTTTPDSSCPDGKTCWYGIPTDLPPAVKGNDFKFAAAFLAAAADKTGVISADMVVYINSILGINKVIGYSAYDAEGNPAPGAVNYSVNPVYFNFSEMLPYNRMATMASRGTVTVLQGDKGGPWTESPVAINDENIIPFRNLTLNSEYLPNQSIAEEDILGFTQMADDNLGVINFIHTYQIPSRK